MAKKNFKPINPALQFISVPKPTFMDMLEQPEKTKKGRPVSKEETKSKRLNLLMFPSVCEDIAKIATMKRSSTNDLIHSILQEYIKDNQELIRRYEDVFKKN